MYEIVPDPFPSVSNLTQLARKEDGFSNALLGLNTSSDKVSRGGWSKPIALDWYTLEGMYYGDSLPKTIVDKIVDDSFSTPFSLHVGNSEEPLDLTLWDSVRATERVIEGLRTARLYGGSVIVVGAFDGQPDLSTPLRTGNVRSVKYLHVLDRRHCSVLRYNEDHTSLDYGLPELYTYTTLQGAMMRVHSTRMLHFDGAAVDVRTRRDLSGWTYSCLQNVFDALRQFVTAMAGAGQLMSDASQAVWKIKNLFAMLASDKGALLERLMFSELTRSTGRAVMLDSDDESFDRVATPLAGYGDVIDRMMMYVASAAGIPATLLFKRSPAGQNATGDADFQEWYKDVQRYRNTQISPQVRKLASLIYKKPVRVEWSPLWQESLLVRAQVRKLEAEAASLESRLPTSEMK